MHSDAFDRYHHGHSPLHNLDPRIKVIVTIAFGLAWVLLLFANYFSGLGIWFTFKRSFIALPFALAAVTVLFTIPGEPVASFHFLRWNLVVTNAGLLRFISIVTRSWLSVQVAILLVAVTEFPKIIHALNHLRVPAVLTTIISFLYRYLFVLPDEVMRIMRARQSRSAAAAGIKAGGSVMWRARTAGNMAGQLFLRSYERSDRIYNAMLSRGYTGHLYTLNPHEMKSRDYFVTAFAIAVLLFIQIIGRL